MTKDSNWNFLEEMSYINEALDTYTDRAITCREEGNFDAAGDIYVAAGHGAMMLFRKVREPSSEGASIGRSMLYFGTGLKRWLAATLCYRLAGRSGRSENLSQRTRLLLTDLIDEEFRAAPEVGLCYEIAADFELAAGLDYEDSYKRARPYYEDVDSDIGWQMEDGFDDFTLVVEELADSVGYDTGKAIENRIAETSLAARIEYKREHFPSIVEGVLEDGNWTSDIF